MKLLVVVVVFVMVSVACADDVVWELAPQPTTQKFMPVPRTEVPEHSKSDVQTQNTQEQTKEPVPSTEEACPKPSDTQSQTFSEHKDEGQQIGREANEIAKKENALTDEGNGIQRWLLWIGCITIGTQVALTLVQLYFIRIANEHAAKAAESAQDSVHVAREAFQTAQRAYLGIENWRFRNDEAGIPIRIEFELYNSGTTPARTIGASWQVHITKMLPPPPDYSQVVINPEKPLLIHSQKNITYAVDLANLLKGVPMERLLTYLPATASLVEPQILSGMVLKIVLDGKMPLYLSGCLVYETVGLCQMMVFFIQYEAVLGRFTVIGESGYNYEMPYNKNKQ